MRDEESERLATAIRWLRSHQKRLLIQRRSLEGQLAKLGHELERLDRELEHAEQRRRELLSG